MTGSGGTSGKSMLEIMTPLLQTGLWVAAVIVVAFVFRREIRQLRVTVGQRLAAGTPFKIGPLEFGEMQRRVEQVESRIDSLQERVVQAFLAAMSDAMFGNLAKLNDGRFGHFDRNPGLERELRYLRDLGYIAVDSVQAIPTSGDNLSVFVTITPRGRNFVALRRELETLQQNTAPV